MSTKQNHLPKIHLRKKQKKDCKLHGDIKINQRSRLVNIFYPIYFAYRRQNN